jgi:hypothetical protein
MYSVENNWIAKNDVSGRRGGSSAQLLHRLSVSILLEIIVLRHESDQPSHHALDRS